MPHAVLCPPACVPQLNAGYMADGYARIKGVGCFSDTYGVGEFSSYNAMMGAKADNVVVFHVVGCPSTRLLDQRRVLHHSLGHGNDEFFPIGCASTVACTRLTALNAIDEVERVIVAGLVQRGPVYIQVPTDVAEQTIMGTPPKVRHLCAFNQHASTVLHAKHALHASTLIHHSLTVTYMLLPHSLHAHTAGPALEQDAANQERAQRAQGRRCVDHKAPACR